jgi:hypothetical protein
MIKSIVELFSYAVQIWTKDENYENENIYIKDLHVNLINTGLKLHKKNFSLNQKVHMRSNMEEMNQHIHHLDSDLINCAIDAERDMFDQVCVFMYLFLLLLLYYLLYYIF